MHPASLALIALTAASAGAVAATPPQWPQFRGPGGNAVAAGESIPQQFGPERNVLWKTPLPDGHSSPCIWGDRIFLTGHEGATLKMLCLRRSDGTVLWKLERILPKLATYEHVAGDPTNPTPATDGERVVFYFDDHGLLATDLEGTLLWEKTMAPTGNDYSYGASPVLHDGRVYLNRDGGLDSGLLCLDAASGDEVWRAARPQAIVSFCTPYVTQHEGTWQILAGGTGALTAYAAASGRELWRVDGLPIFICPSPVATEDRVIFGGWTTAHVSGRTRVESGFDPDSGVSEEALRDPAAFFEQFDTDKDGKLAAAELPPSRARDAFNFLDEDDSGYLEMEEWAPAYKEDAGVAPGRNVVLGIANGGNGKVTESHVRWELTKGLPYVASPLAHRGLIYLVATGGFLTCADAITGERLYERKRLGVGGEYYASPVASGEYLVVCAQRGTVYVVRAGSQPETVHQVDLGETISATPAIVDATLYLRSAKHLWAFREKS